MKLGTNSSLKWPLLTKLSRSDVKGQGLKRGQANFARDTMPPCMHSLSLYLVKLF